MFRFLSAKPKISCSVYCVQLNPSRLLTVAEAEQIILDHCLNLGEDLVPLNEARGRILREDLLADRDFPPFDRVTMDGIAIRYERFAAGQRVFPVAGVQAAGAERRKLEREDACFEVMTGAMLPEGTDTVIRYEDLHLDSGQAEIRIESLVFRQNLHFQGIDRRHGDLIVPAGRKMDAPEIATAAALGKSVLRVASQPRVAIVSTGDELVDVAETPLPYQIRRSNVYAVQALLLDHFQLRSRLFHFPDDKTRITAGLECILTEFDLVILTGAVSEGKFDFVPQILDTLGVEKCFHKIAQRPGKPFWFGQIQKRSVIFALPGNPVSAFLCAWRYLVPFLQRSFGQELPIRKTAVLAEPVEFKPRLTYFLPVKTDSANGGIIQAYPLPGHGSGDLTNLNDTDAFLELPLEQDFFRAGEVFPLWPYR